MSRRESPSSSLMDNQWAGSPFIFYSSTSPPLRLASIDSKMIFIFTYFFVLSSKKKKMWKLKDFLKFENFPLFCVFLLRFQKGVIPLICVCVCVEIDLK